MNHCVYFIQTLLNIYLLVYKPYLNKVNNNLNSLDIVAPGLKAKFKMQFVQLTLRLPDTFYCFKMSLF